MLKKFTCQSDSTGTIHVQCRIPCGTHLLFLTEYENNETVISTNLTVICLTSNTVQMIILLRAVTPDYESVTSGGSVFLIDSEKFKIDSLKPESHVQLILFDSENIHSQEQRINALEKENILLKNSLDSLTQRMMEIYYSPGMPGFLQAQQSFDEVLDQQQQENLHM